MKRYLIPTILTETEFEELKKKAEAGDAAAQLQVAFAYEPTLRNYAEKIYGEHYRFWTTEEDRLNRRKGLDFLSKAKNNGNTDSMLLSAYFWQRELDDPDYDEFGFDKDFGMLDYSDEFKEKKNEEILHDLQTSAKGGNDIAAYRYWMACFSELWWDDSALEDNPSFYTRNTCTEAFDCLKSASDNGEMNSSWEAYQFFTHVSYYKEKIQDSTTDDDERKSCEGFLLLFGLNEISNEEVEENIVKYLKVAASQGHAEAQFDLARAYHGEMISDAVHFRRDDSQFEHWLSKALEQDWAEAYLYLGDMYRNGDGRAKDNDAARKCYFRVIDIVSVPMDKRYHFNRIRTDIGNLIENEEDTKERAYCALGDIFDEEGDYAKAKANYEYGGEGRATRYVKKLKKKGIDIPAWSDYKPYRVGASEQYNDDFDWD